MTRARTRTAVGVRLTPAFLIGAGLIAAATALLEILTETRFVGTTPVGGYVEFLMLALPAVGLLYAGYWLRQGEFEPADVYRIGHFAAGGAVLGAAVTAVTVLLAPLPPIDAGAAFVLLVATGTDGGLLGVLVGTFATTDGLFRSERELAEEFETLHALLRHDLRNRLTIIGGHLTRLAETPDVPDESVETIRAQLHGVERLLDDTGVATEALRGRSGLKRVDVVAVVREQVSMVRDSYEGVVVTMDLPERAAVHGDDLLASVLGNVLSNAVQHNDQPTAELTVRVTAAAEDVQVEVRDNGPGIPTDGPESVFEPGVGDGTGMGLYLVETVVSRYGGTVELGANEPRGAVVTLTLPREDG